MRLLDLIRRGRLELAAKKCDRKGMDATHMNQFWIGQIQFFEASGVPGLAEYARGRADEYRIEAYAAYENAKLLRGAK